MYKLTTAIVQLADPHGEGSVAPLKALEFLSESELDVMKSFIYDEDKTAYCVAHAMVRKTLSGYINLPPSEIPIVTTTHGKPILSPNHPLAEHLHFNISHTRKLVGCIIAPTPCGIDIAVPTQHIPLDTLCSSENRFIHSLAQWQRPAAFAKIWAIKEAFVKAIGSGLPDAPSTIETNVEASPISVTVPRTTSAQWHTTTLSHAKCNVAIVTQGKIPVSVHGLQPPLQHQQTNFVPHGFE